MTIVYENTDILLPITLLDRYNLPISPDDIDSSIGINVYTTDPEVGVEYSKEDIVDGYIAIDYSDITALENGIIRYEYTYSIVDEYLPDGTFDVYNVMETTFYLMLSEESHKSTCATSVSELYNDANYATKSYVNNAVSGLLSAEDLASMFVFDASTGTLTLTI